MIEEKCKFVCELRFQELLIVLFAYSCLNYLFLYILNRLDQSKSKVISHYSIIRKWGVKCKCFQVLSFIDIIES